MHETIGVVAVDFCLAVQLSSQGSLVLCFDAIYPGLMAVRRVFMCVDDAWRAGRDAKKRPSYSTEK